MQQPLAAVLTTEGPTTRTVELVVQKPRGLAVLAACEIASPGLAEPLLAQRVSVVSEGRQFSVAVPEARLPIAAVALLVLPAQRRCKAGPEGRLQEPGQQSVAPVIPASASEEMAAPLPAPPQPAQVERDKSAEATEGPIATLPAAAGLAALADLDGLMEASAGIPQTRARLPLEQPGP